MALDIAQATKERIEELCEKKARRTSCNIEYGCQNGTRLLIVLRLRVALKFYHTDEYAEKTYNFYYCPISH